MKPRIWPRRTMLHETPAGVSANGAAGEGGSCVSVVIPTYNRVDLLPRAIRSVLAQTFRDLELIVVDGASDDGTRELLPRYQDARLRVVREKANRGIAHGRNAGIAEARGEWVAFLDDDDEWLPEKLERQMARVTGAAGKEYSVVYCDAQHVLAPGSRLSRDEMRLVEGDVLDDLLAVRMPTFASAFVVRRSALLAVGGFDETMDGFEDFDLWLRLACASQRFAVVPEALIIKHAGHGRNVTADSVSNFRSFHKAEGRWGRLRQERLSVEFCRRLRGQAMRGMGRRHRKIAKRLLRAGNRAEAWRYARRMAPVLPWAASPIAQALLVAAFGGWPYRARRAVKALARRGGHAAPPVETKE